MTPSDGTGTVTYSYDSEGTPLGQLPRGSAIQVSAPGGDVPAFSGSVSLPAAVEGLEAGADSPLQVSLSSGATVRWTPEESDGLEIGLFMATTMAGYNLICPAEDSGSYQITPQVLGLLPVVEDPNVYAFWVGVFRKNRTSVVAGEYRVALLGIQAAVRNAELVVP